MQMLRHQALAIGGQRLPQRLQRSVLQKEDREQRQDDRQAPDKQQTPLQKCFESGFYLCGTEYTTEPRNACIRRVKFLQVGNNFHVFLSVPR
ncbi:MAG: hypothetical protein ACREEM_16070, partial [Blastocatellia bacterium]